MEYWETLGVSNKGNVYSISTMGRVWSSKNGILKTPRNQGGYPHLSLEIDGNWHRHLVHRVQAAAFLPNPDNKPTVNHKNGIRHDNRLENLEWATMKEQNVHSVDILGRKAPLNNHRRKTIKATKDGKTIEVKGIRELARTLNMPYQGIQRILKNKRKTYHGWVFEVTINPNWVSKSGLAY